MMDEILGPLLYPRGPSTSDVFELIITERFRRKAALELAHLAAKSLLDTVTFEQLRMQLPTHEFARETVWHFSSGVVTESSPHQAPEAARIDQFLLALAVSGLSFSFDFKSRGKFLHTAYGRVIDTGEIRSVESSCGRLIYKDAGGSHVIEDDPKTATAGPILTTSTSRRIQVLDRGSAPSDLQAGLDGELLESSSHAAEAIELSLSLMGRVSPDYLQWSTTAVTSIAPVFGPSGSMISGSQGHFPGQIYISGGASPVRTSEMIIHEASHQYFSAIEATCHLVNGATDEHFFSAVVGRYRPVAKLLLAYHAFANVLRFMNLLSQTDERLEADFVRKNIVALKSDLSSLGEGLESSRTLSPEGRHIWRILKEVTALA